MLICWHVEYFDRTDRQFNDRDLFVDTATLLPAKRAAVELASESLNSGDEREFLKFRSLFTEGTWADWAGDRLRAIGEWKLFSLHDYFEDENGDKITMAEIGPILTGDPNGVIIPSGTQQYHIDYMCAEKPPVPLAEVTLSTDEARLLGYFVRDFAELRDSALMKEGAGTGRLRDNG